ncbi:hypothetical protein BKA70DRAFT_1215085 [Coprinopsis sp. MPI-PUGE-AT-0042]|nr:hypothetical protein BKA70DRAFT_1215085 [Coprinopsis sp. MPI-PUGE-AT-0042]
MNSTSNVKESCPQSPPPTWSNRSFPGSSKDKAVTIPLGMDFAVDDPQYSDVRSTLLQYGHATHNLLVGSALLTEAFRNVIALGTQFVELRAHRDQQLALFLAMREDYESQGFTDVVAYLDKHKNLLDERAVNEVRNAVLDLSDAVEMGQESAP